MIRILHCVSKMDRAGQEAFIMNVYRAIDKSKYQFVFLCSNSEPGAFDEEIRHLGGNIYTYEYYKNLSSNKLIKYTTIIHRLSDWLKKHRDKFDIIHVHTYHAIDVFVHLEACRRAKVRSVIIHSHNTNGPHRTLHYIFRNINELYSFTHVACSTEAGYWLYGKKTFEVVFNGIDTEAYRFNKKTRIEVRKSLGINGKKVIGHVGRFSYQKNHRFLIDVFRELSLQDTNYTLLLIGKGELQHEIIKYCEKLGLNDRVMFLGERNDVDRILNAMDLFLFPSYYEGLSVVLVEAQCNGLPIICNNNISPETVISDSVFLTDLSDITVWIQESSKHIGIRTNNICYDSVDVKNTCCKITDIYDTYFC